MTSISSTSACPSYNVQDTAGQWTIPVKRRRSDCTIANRASRRQATLSLLAFCKLLLASRFSQVASRFSLFALSFTHDYIYEEERMRTSYHTCPHLFTLRFTKKQFATLANKASSASFYSALQDYRIDHPLTLKRKSIQIR